MMNNIQYIFFVLMKSVIFFVHSWNDGISFDVKIKRNVTCYTKQNIIFLCLLVWPRDYTYVVLYLLLYL